MTMLLCVAAISASGQTKSYDDLASAFGLHPSASGSNIQRLIELTRERGKDGTLSAESAKLFGFGSEQIQIRKIVGLNRALAVSPSDNYKSIVLSDSFLNGTKTNPSAREVYFFHVTAGGNITRFVHSVDRNVIEDSIDARDAQLKREVSRWIEELSANQDNGSAAPRPAPSARNSSFDSTTPRPEPSARTSGSGSVPAMTRWQDPNERAFTLNVPSGWRITGGTVRHSRMDARNYVVAESPDQKIRVWLNDPDVLPRQEPHPMYASLGWTEGRTVKGPAGPLFIERFRTGAQFAREISEQKLCRNLRPLSAFDLRKESQQMNAEIASAAARVNAHVQSAAGELMYECGNLSGYTYSVTVLASGTRGGPRVWTVERLSGYLAGKSELDLARYVMNAMISSFRVDPAWQRQYERDIQDTTGALIEISNRVTQQSIQLAQQSLQQNMRQVQQRQQQFDQMSKMREDSFKRQMNSQDNIRQRWSDITLGQIHGCDDNGNCSEQSNEYQNHWVDPSGKVVGGPSDGSSPGPGYRQWTPDYK